MKKLIIIICAAVIVIAGCRKDRPLSPSEKAAKDSLQVNFKKRFIMDKR